MVEYNRLIRHRLNPGHVSLPTPTYLYNNKRLFLKDSQLDLIFTE